MQSKGRKSIVEEMGTEEEKRIIADARLKMSGGTSAEGEEKAGAITAMDFFFSSSTSLATSSTV